MLVRLPRQGIAGGRRGDFIQWSRQGRQSCHAAPNVRIGARIKIHRIKRMRMGRTLQAIFVKLKVSQTEKYTELKKKY
jgi:hypothetical protein